MTKKSQSNHQGKKSQRKGPKTFNAKQIVIDPRKELLVRIAGSIAARLVTSPSPSIASAASMAAVAVDIAEEILQKAGIPEDGRAGASDSESSHDDHLGAAS